MLLKLIKTNRNAGIYLFPLLLLGILVFQVKLTGTISPDVHENARLIPGLPELYMKEYPLLKSFLATVIVLLVCMLLLRINREFIFLNSWSVLPVLLFLFMVLGLPEYGKLHPVWFSALFILPAISRLFLSFEVRKPYRYVFEAGFLLGLGSLFYFNLLFLLPAFVIGGRTIIRDARWREPFLVFFGVFVLWLMAFAAYFLADRMPVLLEWMKLSTFQPVDPILKNIPLLIFMLYLGILIFSGSITILKQYSGKKVRFRKYFTFLFFIFLTALLSFLFLPGCSTEMLIIAAIPVSFLLSNYFDVVKKSLFREIAFLMIIFFGLILFLIQVYQWPGF